jgi:rRNA maturation endonuclease Nob1
MRKMTKTVYVFLCENCDQYVDTHDLVCTICGAEALRRTEVTVITDGAPTGSSDTDFVKGFREGQDYSIEQFTKDVDDFCERVDELSAKVAVISQVVDLVAEQVKDLINDPLPCVDCGVLVDRSTHKEELGFCVSCQHKYFDEGIER